MRSETRLSESYSQLGKDAFGGNLERAFDRASAGAAMAAAAEVLGDSGNVDLSFAANTEAEQIDVWYFA